VCGTDSLLYCRRRVRGHAPFFPGIERERAVAPEETLAADTAEEGLSAPRVVLQPAGTAARRRRSDPVAALVRRVDATLRRHYGIREFTDDPMCILRLSRERAWRGLLLSDGTPIGPGEPVGELHFWSEHMPAFAHDGPNLGWAVETSRQLRRSFALLAAALARDPLWLDLRAVFARWAFAGAFDATHQRRLIDEFGLDIIAPDRTISHRIHDLMQDFLLWGMLRAFNPGALHSHGFFRSRQELWISRPGVLAHFAGAQPGRAAAARPPPACAGPTAEY
jgi:hypothetical protein